LISARRETVWATSIIFRLRYIQSEEVLWTGEVIGSKTLVKVATGADPNLERRATLLFFTFADRKDQMLTNLSPVRFQWNRQVDVCAWPGHQHAGCGWFVYASIHVIEVIGMFRTVPR
jgi:hypothetical protein